MIGLRLPALPTFERKERVGDEVIAASTPTSPSTSTGSRRLH